MIRVATYEQGIAEEQRQREEVEAPARRIFTDSLAEEDEPFLLALSARIDTAWQRNRQNKSKVEHIMLQCARDRKGEYGPQELQMIQETGGSDIYMPVAQGKVRAGIAHIKSIYLSALHASHGISPTPNPQLPPELEDTIIQRIVQNPNMVDEQGNPVDPTQQVEMLARMARRKMEEMSATAARAHEALINDQLLEGGYYSALSEFIEDFCTYPAAFLKGPYFSVEPRMKWERMASMEVVPTSAYETVVKFRTINPFDAYPAPGVDSVHKGDFFERLRMNRADLYRNRKQPGYNEQAVLDALADADSGKLTDWLWTDSARANIADHNFFWYESTTDLDGLQWLGQARGTDLLEWGMDPRLIDDPLDFFEVDAIKIGRHVVRAALNPDPLYRRNIHSSCYEKIPGSVFGNSISMLMSSSQRMINATARSLQNNLAYASGFQTQVYHERVAPETDIHDQHPHKVWQVYESEINTSGHNPAVEYFQPADHSINLSAIIDRWKGYTDTDTGIPEFLSGGQGNGGGADETARGRAMLLDASAKLLRSSIMNIDEDIVVPKIEMLYVHNMLHHPDTSIKGDCQIEARGANAILQRESARQEHMAMLELTGANPLDAQIIGIGGRAKMLQHIFGTYDDMKDKILPDGEEFDALIEKLEAQQNQPPPPDPAMIKAQSDAEINQQQLQLDAQRLQLEAASQDPTAERELKQMELASRERIAQAQLDKQMRDEIIKYRAEKMAERAKAQIEVEKTKLQAETEIRLRVAEMKAQRDNGREQRAFDASNAEPAAPVEPQLTEDDIKSAVEMTVVPLIETLKGETLSVMNELIAKFTAETAAAAAAQPSAPPVFNITVDSQAEPVAKTISATRAEDGSMTGTVTPVARRDRT